MCERAQLANKQDWARYHSYEVHQMAELVDSHLRPGPWQKVGYFKKASSFPSWQNSSPRTYTSALHQFSIRPACPLALALICAVHGTHHTLTGKATQCLLRQHCMHRHKQQPLNLLFVPVTVRFDSKHSPDMCQRVYGVDPSYVPDNL